MKKIIILSCISATLIFADYSRTTINKSNDRDSNYKDDYIDIKGKVFNIDEYSDHTVITIETKEHGRVRARVNYTNVKEDSIVRGGCREKEYGVYQKCRIN